MDIFQSYSIDDVVRIGIAIVVLFSGLLAILFTLWGGFLMIVSGGKEEKIKPAVNHIRHAFIGLIFIFAVLFIAPKIMDLLGLEGSKYASPGAVFTTVSDLSNRFFSPSSTSESPFDSSSPVIDDNFSNL